MRNYFSILFLVLAMSAKASLLTLPEPLPWNLALPTLETFIDRTPGTYDTNSWGNGSYNNGSSNSTSNPGHDYSTNSGNWGNWNYSNAAGYTIDPAFFSLYAGVYSWDQWGSWSNKTDNYYGPWGSSSFGPYANDDHARENALSLNIFSPDWQIFFLNQFVMYNSNDTFSKGFCSSYTNEFGFGGGCSSISDRSSYNYQNNTLMFLTREEFLNTFYAYGDTERPFSDTPEPTTWALLGSGLVGVAVLRRRK